MRLAWLPVAGARDPVYPLDRYIIPGVLIGGLCGLLVVGSWLGAALGAGLPLLISITWRAGLAPVFPVGLGIQWLQVACGHVYGGMTGRPLLAISPPQTARATYLALLALLALAVGIRLGLRRSTASAASSRSALPAPRRLLPLALGLVLAGPVFSALAWRIPALTQPLQAVLLIKWLILFLFFRAILVQGRGQLAGALVLLGEVFIGFSSFFSTWKTPFLVLIVAFLTTRGRLPLRRLAEASALAALALGLAVLWMDVRQTIRDQLTADAQAPRSEVLANALDSSRLLVSGREQIVERLDHLVERTSYVYYFAHVVGRIPDRSPHEGGQLYLNAVRHVLMPRLLFPSKPALVNDSWYVAEYAGIRVPVVEGGTNISIGYVTESYVDFGPVLMFLPLLGWGLLLGLMVRAFLRLPLAAELQSGLIVAVFFLLNYQFEIPLVKMIGGQLTAFLVVYAGARFFGQQAWRRLVPAASSPPAEGIEVLGGHVGELSTGG